jgi:signal transduction histidine kinase
VDYIVKPYNPSILVSKVQVFLEMYRQRAELRRHREQLAAMNSELEAFAYSVSHDLRAPLRAIEGFSQALLEDCPAKLNEQERDYLGRISAEARRMAQLIDDLLALSRVTRAEMQTERVSITDAANDVVEQMRASEPERRVVVEVAEGLTASGDPRLLRQALENLLSNAWKFTGKASDARIVIGATEVDGKQAFFVRDNGAGFDTSYASKIFTPFQRLHSMKEFPGTGVGLSTVMRIVQRHGGRIWFESEVGQGTTFFFTLGTGEETSND